MPQARVDSEQLVADVTVIGGAGRDGLATVLAFANAGLRVNVNDADASATEMLRSGRLPFVEYGGTQILVDALNAKRLVFTNSPQAISPKGPVIIAVGTDVDEFDNPDREHLTRCLEGLLPHLKDDRLVVLRAGVLPGTTDWVAAFLKDRGLSNPVVFCPERVVQGYGVRENEWVPQLVGSATPEGEEKAIALFAPVVSEFVALSPLEAEFARLFNNVYRYIDIAATNEFYLIAKSAGVDYHRVLLGMQHNNPRARNIPNPGFAAGPNLLLDTQKVTAYAGHKFGLSRAATMINEGIVLYIVGDLLARFDIPNMTVGLLGMAFKAESDDIRASLSYKFKKVLKLHARNVLTTDPYVTSDADILPLHEVVERSDLLVLCTPHACYRSVDLQSKPVVDVWRFLSDGNLIR
jgi:UDP-N-acetyl-D-mannosaminuronic acid dehydrogenase